MNSISLVFALSIVALILVAEAEPTNIELGAIGKAVGLKNITLNMSITGTSADIPICNITSDASYHDFVSYAGFISREDLDKFYQFTVAKDFTAASKFLNDSLLRKTATTFEEGEVVYVEDNGGLWGTYVKIRLKGETQSYWTLPDAIECPQA
jgi:hypothetical protein